MPRIAKSTKELVLKQLKWANSQLETCISQDDKSLICTMIEKLLHNANMYHGFNYLYWTKHGHHEWLADGGPGFPEKNKYITGLSYSPEGTYKDKIRGEFSRYYYE